MTKKGDKSEPNKRIRLKKLTGVVPAYTISEIVFVLVPMVTLYLGLKYIGKDDEIFNEPEWSVASSVMSGQSIIKLILAYGKDAKKGVSLNAHRLIAFISIIILFSLVPSVSILIIMIVSENHIDCWIVKAQILLFGFSMAIFILSNIRLAKSE